VPVGLGQARKAAYLPDGVLDPHALSGKRLV
jgi:hypothetical protein